MRKSKPKRNRRPADLMPEESQAADALTIGWMLATITTLICQIGALGARWAALGNPAVRQLNLFSGFLFFAAMAIGAVTLALIPVLYRIRKLAPPRAVVVFAVVVAIAPWVTLVVQWLR
jgi:hypothetical protein